MLSEYIFYKLGKRKARKKYEQALENLLIEEGAFDQDTRTVEQLLQEARKNSANKNNQ